MSHETLEDCEKALVEVNRWFQTNSLRLNLKKTNLMQLVTKSNLKTPMGITINQTYTEDTLNTNFLGVTLDSTLSWCSHIERISNKLKLLATF